jgi:hypothetical protein
LRIAELEDRIKLLSDLLNVETTKTVAEAEGEEIREELSQEKKEK